MIPAFTELGVPENAEVLERLEQRWSSVCFRCGLVRLWAHYDADRGVVYVCFYDLPLRHPLITARVVVNGRLQDSMTLAELESKALGLMFS